MEKLTPLKQEQYYLFVRLFLGKQFYNVKEKRVKSKAVIFLTYGFKEEYEGFIITDKPGWSNGDLISSTIYGKYLEKLRF